MKSPRPACRLVALVVIDVCVLAVPALAQDCPELVGYLPYHGHGEPLAVAASGHYAYVGTDAGLVVADVSDVSAPVEVGFVHTNEAVGVVVSGGYVYYLACCGGGLRVIDVSEPTAPVVVGSTTGFNGHGIVLSGDFVYVAGYEGLRVIDVSTPWSPSSASLLLMPYGASDVAVSGGFAYVTDFDSDSGQGGLRVIDVSTPSAPSEVAFLDMPHGATNVAVSGGFAYVSYLGYDSEKGGLSVIDVSTPSTPVALGSVNTPTSVNAIAVSGGYAYVACAAGLRAIDVSNPTAPVEVGFVDTRDQAWGVAISRGYAYVAEGGHIPFWGGWGGLAVIDVSTPSAPVEVGFVDTSRRAEGVAVSGGYAYVVTEASGLRVTDVSTPFAPVEVGFVHTRDLAWGVAVSDGYAYVAEGGWSFPNVWWGGLAVIDVSTPSAPVEVGFLDTPDHPEGVAVDGNHAYVTNLDPISGQGGLTVIDVSTPSTPLEEAFLDMPGWAFAVAVEGGYAYIAWGERNSDGGGLRVIDVSTPSAPVEAGFVDTPGRALDVAVEGGYAHVAWADWSGGGGLQVIDVSTPSAPVLVGSLEMYATDVAISGGFAYVVGDGLRVIDISTPWAPVAVGLFVTSGDASGVAVSGGYVFLAAWDAGLYVFRECTGGPAPDAHESFIPAAAVAAGAEGAFFQTDLEINNTGTEEAEVRFQWLPRGEDNSEPIESEPIALAAGQSLRYENVLAELFGLGPDSLGALKLVASTESVIGMSRTYNIPAGETAGTFGQGLPAIRATEMIAGTEPQRIIFLSENDDARANVGCVNGSSEPVTINIGLFNAEGEPLETKTMDLAPNSNDQINRVFQDYAPVNGYVDVWADSDDALYYCYGSMLDNETSDPTMILPQVPSDDTTFIPAAALAEGLEGAFFQTDVDLNNVGSTDLTYELLWLPRGADNTEPTRSDVFSLAPGADVRYANVLDEVFGLDPDQVGALALEASGIDLLAMSRTYNLPSAKVAGTFGQELPGIPADRMIATGVKKRIIFMSENDDVRANVGCVNGGGTEVAVQIELYGSDGVKLETKYMMLPPYSNRQINGIFQDYAPINGYVDVRTYTSDALIYCYGSVLDNLTSDPTTVLPQ